MTEQAWVTKGKRFAATQRLLRVNIRPRVTDGFIVLERDQRHKTGLQPPLFAYVLALEDGTSFTNSCRLAFRIIRDLRQRGKVFSWASVPIKHSSKRSSKTHGGRDRFCRRTREKACTDPEMPDRHFFRTRNWENQA